MIAAYKFSSLTSLLAGVVGIFLMVQPASGGAISVTNSTPGTFDASIGNRAVTISGFEPGFGTGVIADINVTIDYTKVPDAAGQPFFQEIHFAIIAPNGEVVELIAANSFNSGAVGAQFDGVQTFDQSAPTVVNANPDLPTAGTFRPTGPGSLNDFNGDSAMGTWTLFIEDTVSADPLRFRSFRLDVTTRDFSVPEPASLILLSLAMFGWVSRRTSLN